MDAAIFVPACELHQEWLQQHCIAALHYVSRMHDCNLLFAAGIVIAKGAFSLRESTTAVMPAYTFCHQIFCTQCHMDPHAARCNLPLLAAGLFVSSQVSTPETEAALQRIAAPEQDATSLDTAAQSASTASDMFMLGGVTYEMVVGKPAFPAKDDGLGRARRWQVTFVHQSSYQQVMVFPTCMSVLMVVMHFWLQALIMQVRLACDLALRPALVLRMVVDVHTCTCPQLALNRMFQLTSWSKPCPTHPSLHALSCHKQKLFCQ